ncbi:MAG: hypothetical protein WCI02_07470 [Planctomycetota bacterium]
MNLVRFTVLVFGLVLVVGCGDAPKGPTPSSNPAPKPPTGTSTVTNADGSTSEGASNAATQPVLE